jgi:hypothetical protein
MGPAAAATLIEDEPQVADSGCGHLRNLMEIFLIQQILSSVREALKW